MIKHILNVMMLLVLALLLSSCTSIGARLGTDRINRPYEPTCRDLDALGDVFSEDEMTSGLARLYSPIFLIHLPFSFIVDTLMLPFDLWDLQYEQKPSENITQEEYQRLTNKARVAFSISGSVVDENGHKLNGVKIRIVENHSIGFKKWVRKEHEETINGNFKIYSKGNDIISLSFQKEGYHDKNNFCFSRLSNKDKIKDGVLKISDFKTVLHQKGKLADLLTYEGTIKFDSSGKATVLSFQQKTDEYGDVIKPEKGKNFKEIEDNEELLQVDNIYLKNALPKNCIYAVADCDDSDKIKTKLLNDDYYFPKTVRLYFSAPESGFIIYKPRQERVKQIWRNMPKAPPNGYRQELVIDDKELGKGQDIYFYFKAGEKYGKGCIRYIDYRGEEGVFRPGDDEYVKQKGNGTLEIVVECRVNPDGTRNLESLD